MHIIRLKQCGRWEGCVRGHLREEGGGAGDGMDIDMRHVGYKFKIVEE